VKPEAALQRTIIQGLRVALPHGWIVAHVPNGGKRSEVEGAIFKAMGVVAGFPDILIMGVKYFGDDEPQPVCCLIEVKAGKGRLSDAQLACHDRLSEMNFPVAVVRSWDETVSWCRAWGLPLRIDA
jgi:hypothetical protein